MFELPKQLATSLCSNYCSGSPTAVLWLVLIVHSICREWNVGVQTTAQIVKTSVTQTNHTRQISDTPGFKPFTDSMNVWIYIKAE